MIVIYFVAFLGMARGGPSTESYKDQFCTDPRTMKKHAAYTEWADAYSCTRHRCQPGGRNLAIYTVGCKRVEAPESAIECEEVVEDTNMQFPFCCTRLRCLVVVRGEVWTRVLGQPWETLPAAPWSHMYKMKKPPPGDSPFLLKTPEEGPIYELTSDAEGDKVLRASKKSPTDNTDCNEVAPRSVPTPDIVIALSTGNEAKDHKSESKNRHKRGRKLQSSSAYFEKDAPDHHNEVDVGESATEKEKSRDALSDEKYYSNTFGVTQKPFKSHHQISWTEVPPNQWNDHELPLGESEAAIRDGYALPEFEQTDEKKDEKPSNLQALVDAIGTRMKDIENVVQRMSEKVHQVKPGQPDNSGEKRPIAEAEIQALQLKKHRKGREENEDHREYRTKRPNPDGDHYKRFSVRNRGSKYLHTTDSTTEQPLFIEDSNLNGYFSDASNSVLRRVNHPKEPAATYMAPVENRRKASHILLSDMSEEAEKKHKKHTHKKKKNKGRGHKKHRKEEKKSRVNKTNSVEVEKNVISLEDSSAIGNA